MSKREYERKIREDQEATAHVFQEFIHTFQDAPTVSKTFVKSGVLYADRNKLKPLDEELYNPTPIIKSTTSMRNALECAKLLKETKIEKSRKKEKPKSNLELLKEELKQRHSEKDEREKLKEEIIMSGPALSYFDGGDPNSTNLFVANLNTSVTESNLMEEFGLYGPLASVKIMWPRGEEKFKNLNTNCGFVAFMSRRDAERALNHMKHRTDMRVGWGKSVDLPPHPVYIPQELLRLYLPPPQSGLPFNAQPDLPRDFDDDEDIDAALYDSFVKVTIPLSKKVLMLVNRMVEFVAKEGPLFEAMIMNTELANPDFNFLFENKSPIHVYYRWKLFSVLQGDSTKQWSMKPFRMFKGGSIWLPPVAPNYTEGMPEQLVKDKNASNSFLSENQCNRLIELVQNLNLSRPSIAEAMVFSLNHIPAINDSLSIIVDSLCNSATNPVSKIARFYLLSDILSNCITMDIPINNIQTHLETVIEQLQKCFESLSHNLDKKLFASKVLRVISQLDEIGLITMEFIKKAENCFTVDSLYMEDGNSSSDEPLDGANLLKRSLKSSCDECIITPSSIKTAQEAKIQQEYFIPSKWDTIDPDEVEAQAMSSEKLFYMELDNSSQMEEHHDLAFSSKRSPSPTKRKEKSKKHKSDKSCNSPKRHSSKYNDKKRKNYRK